MSRICGIIEPRQAQLEPALLDGMLEAARSQKSWHKEVIIESNLAFGWTGWRQADIARKDKIVVAIDGFIYNSDEMGITESRPASIVANMYQKHGIKGALQRINGDFALAIYDGNQDKLFLGRDRIGLKPLYYNFNGRHFSFASRPASLLKLPWISSDYNARFVAIFAACHYRYFDNDPDASPYEQISQLPAGGFLEFSGQTPSIGRYWSLQEAPELRGSEEDLAEEYKSKLAKAVKDRLSQAERPGFTLSGGMDSSSVLSLAVDLGNEKRDAFSSVYADKTYDESEDILPMLESKVSQWYQVRVDDPDVFGLVDQMVRLHDEPVATATWLSHNILCQQASQQGFGSLFGGLGGDELNAGEYEYFFFHFADLLKAGEKKAFDQEVKWWAHYHDHPIYRKNRQIAMDTVSRVADLEHGRCLPEPSRLTRYLGALNSEFYDLAGFKPVMDHPFTSFLKNRTYQDIFRETAPCCLRAEDRQTVAYGMDNFLPFFDYQVIEFMFRVPGTLKIKNGITKYLLRLAMKGTLPEETRRRVTKTGWNAPAHLWFSGKGEETLRDLIASQAFRQRGIYQLNELEHLLSEHQEIVNSGEPRENHMMFFWQLVNLESWLRIVENKP